MLYISGNKASENIHEVLLNQLLLKNILVECKKILSLLSARANLILKTLKLRHEFDVIKYPSGVQGLGKRKGPPSTWEDER